MDEAECYYCLRYATVSRLACMSYERDFTPENPRMDTPNAEAAMLGLTNIQ
jgi:hypothetical protein